jgi:arylsulfatase A-like enzyme
MKNQNIAVIVVSLLATLVVPLVAAERPNIVVILADDLGYGDLRCYNRSSKIPTPQLDELARQGTRFTDAHTPSSLCTPTRYGLLTGRYCWRTSLKRGVLNGQDPSLIEPGRATIASMLKQAGYKTACIGKWHLGLGTNRPVDYSKPLMPGPRAAGFDYFFGIPASLDMPPYVYVENERVVEAPTETIDEGKHQREGGFGFWRAGPIAPSFKHAEVLDTLTQKAVEFLRSQKSDEPFFLYLALTAPHTPLVPAAEFAGKSRAGDYGDFVAQMDDCVGRVLKAVDENALVIFTSDNGAHWPRQDIKQYGHRANGSLRGQKGDLWEGGHRVPFIVRWPGKVKPRSTSERLICVTDVMATIARFVNLQNPGEDSIDFLSGPPRVSIVHHSGDGTFAIREGKWKLCTALGSHGFSEPRSIRPDPGGPTGQLFDLERDVRENYNVWKRHPQVVMRLLMLLGDVRGKSGTWQD